MQVQTATIGRIISYDNDRGPLTLKAAILKRGLPLPKPKSVKHYNAAVRRQGDRQKYFPADQTFAHHVMIERQSPLWYQDVPDDVSDGQLFSSRGLTDWYVGEFCKLNHLKG